ncbi:unnamed protein product [Diatraea saccharalis]|uniref:VASt domain-containing protein n=1 Tax=Diatraea saccharalis TaxID=40085 RepID=A0A9N9WD12_9NEOP|nr:unnamed protein product [Diatraea saccharalis]
MSKTMPSIRKSTAGDLVPVRNSQGLLLTWIRLCFRSTGGSFLTNGDAASYREEEGGDTLPTDMSDTSDSEPDKPNNGEGGHKCTASHEGRQLLQQEVPFNIDQLFTMMFTNSKFNLELLAARGTTDYVQAPWEVADGLKCRQISYTLGLTSGPIGPKEVHVTETQVMNKCSKPGVLYSIDACSENTGIPYADYFSVRVHYCLARVHDTRTALHVHAHIHYKKSMWATIRGFLEKNAISGLEQFCRLLLARLQAEAEGAAPAARKARRQRRNTGGLSHFANVSHSHAIAAERGTTPSVGENNGTSWIKPICKPSVSSQEPVLAAAAKSPAAALGALGGGGAAARGAGARGGGGGGALLGGAVLLLLLVNAALYWGLHHALLHHPAHRVESGGEGGGGQGAAWAEWARVLQLHAARQRGELRAWRRALDDTRRHLHQRPPRIRPPPRPDRTYKRRDSRIRSTPSGRKCGKPNNSTGIEADVDECWNILKEGMVDTAKEMCGCTKRHKTIKGYAWWDAEVEKSVAERKKGWIDYDSSFHLSDTMKELKNETQERLWTKKRN